MSAEEKVHALLARAQISPEYARRALWTVGLLFALRLLTQIPALEVEPQRMNQLLADNPWLAVIDLLAGGETLAQFSVAAAGLFPHLFAAVVVRGFAWTIPALRAASRSGADMRERLARLEKLARLPLALLFAWVLTRYLSRQSGLFPDGVRWFTLESLWPTLGVVGLVTAGSLVTSFLTDTITAKGVADGEKVVLLCSSGLALVQGLADIVFGTPEPAARWTTLGAHAAVGGIVVVLAIVLLKAERRIPINLPRAPAAVAKYIYLPLRLVRDATLPIAAAVGMMLLAKVTGQFFAWAIPGGWPAAEAVLAGLTDPAQSVYWVALAGLIAAATLLVNLSTILQPFANTELGTADLLRRQGAFITGIRPGAATERHLLGVTFRISVAGAAAATLLGAGLPALLRAWTGEDYTAAILAVFVFVQAAEHLRDRWFTGNESVRYDSLLRRR
jgi:preprotein translocase subunit SecY